LQWPLLSTWVIPLCVIPLSNDAVGLVTRRSGLDLFPLLAAALYVYVVMRRPQALLHGMRWSGRSARLAASAGFLLAAPSLLFFLHPILVANVNSAPATPVSIGAVNGLLRFVLLDVPFLTAIVEELVFRELLYVKVGSLPRTLTFNALLFTVWHGVAAYTAVQGTAFGRSPGLLALAYVVALVAVFIAGVTFALVRHKTGSFAYAALAHWICASMIVVALFATAHRW
jgi:membrane protease YdiL (CAAX protease family)